MQIESGGLRAVEGEVLPSLAAMARQQGFGELAERLGDVQRLAQDDLVACAGALMTMGGAGVVQQSARTLLAAGGKRVRPICVSLCAQLGVPNAHAVRDLATAAELVHSATLLHDDVVDVGETRRGRPTARSVFGNAASIFAGDWLLVEALRRVRAHELPGTLEALLSTIDEMIVAESLQLGRRGTLHRDRDLYFRVARGKTAALFRWACGAGARAGGLPSEDVNALCAFGEHLGLAFQLIDDLLDLQGDPQRTGKALFVDLREGKITFPLIVMLERAPGAGELLAPFLGEEVPDASATPRLLAALERTGAVQASREVAMQHVEEALSVISRLQPSMAVEALRTVALAAVARDR